MRLCILISVVCVLTAFGAVQPKPGFDPNDVVRAVSRQQSAVSRQLGGEAFLIDTNSALVPSPGSHKNAAVGFDGTNYLVVWEDQLGGSYSTICGARVTPQGTVLDPSGILISDAAFDRGSPALCFDGTNYMVVWQDYRKGWAYYVYGARVTPGGQVLDPIGFTISKGPNDARNPALSFDGTNFLVAWEDYNTDVNHPDIYGARVTPGGSVLDTANFAIGTAVHGQYTPAVGSDGTNSLVVWSDLRDSAHAHIYGARVTPAGAVLDMNGFAISRDSGSQDEPDLRLDGANFLVAWRFHWDSLGIPLGGIHGARVTPGGTVLDPSAIIISSVAGASPVVGFDGANSLVAWYCVTGLSPAYYTVYGARVTPAGAVLDTAAIAIARTALWSQTFPAVGFDGANYLTVWQDERNKPGEPDLYGARVTPGGGVLDTSGFLITRSARGQYVPAADFDGTNFLVVWEDDRNGYTDIYGTRVTPDGTVLDPNGIVICHAPSWQYNPSIAFDGTYYLVVWQDHRNGVDNPDIYGARVTPGGQVLDTSGIAISQAPNRQYHPAVAFGGTDFLVVWQDYRSSHWDIYGTRVTHDGFVLNTDGIVISQAPSNQTFPAIGFDGSNYLVAWQDDRNGAYDIYGTRVSPSGTVLDPNGFVISGAQGEQESPVLTFGGSNYLVAWEDYRRSVYSDIFGARVTPQGTVLDTAGIALSTSEYDQLGPALAYDGSNYLVLWEDCCNSGNPDIYGARLSPDGTAFDFGRVVQQDGVQSCLALARDPGSHLFLVYQSWTGTIGDQTYNTDRIWGDMDPTLGQGIEENQQPTVRGSRAIATVVRGVLFLGDCPRTGTVPKTVLLDAAGRKVMDLKPGVNDVSHLAPGVYFVRAVSRELSAVSCSKVVIAR